MYKQHITVTLKTKRGNVVVEFDEKGHLVYIWSSGNSNHKWSVVAWKRERPRLIRRARQYCRMIGDRR